MTTQPPGQAPLAALSGNAVHIIRYYEVWCPVCLHCETHETREDAAADAGQHGEHCTWLAEKPAGYYRNREIPKDRIFPTKLQRRTGNHPRTSG